MTLRSAISFLILMVFLRGTTAFALTGDTIVCAGYIYSYNASIPGAINYSWTFPSGWYDINGQGTGAVNATCNVNTGDICVEGFDVNANSVGVECITTQWGGGGAYGREIYPSSFYYCVGQDRDVHFSLVANGTVSGGCPSGCGNGTIHPNLVYGLYNSTLPNNLFMGELFDSALSIIILPPIVTTYHFYYVDISAGQDFPDAIMITGGCPGAVNNNEVNSVEVIPWMPQFTQSPEPVCIADTVVIIQTNSAVDNLSWSAINCSIIAQPDSEQVVIVANGSNPQLQYDGWDNMHYCYTSGSYSIQTQPCYPEASFIATDTSICPGSCTDFLNASDLADSYQWIFSGASVSSDTSANPSGICYTSPGSYDVTLIATNAWGTDTLIFPGYIHVYPFSPSQGIIQSNDTLYSNGGFTTYQWYYNGNLIAGATDTFYVATLNGDYNLICADSNGCEVEAAAFGVITSIQESSSLKFSLSPNPVRDILEIRFKESSDVMIRIFSAGGSQTEIPAAKCNGGNGPLRIDVSGLAKGIYYVEIESSKNIQRKKIVKV